jgi:hypothetical protein
MTIDISILGNESHCDMTGEFVDHEWECCFCETLPISPTDCACRGTGMTQYREYDWTMKRLDDERC